MKDNYTYSKDLRNYGNSRKQYDNHKALNPDFPSDNNVYHDDEETSYYLNELNKFLDKKPSIELMDDELDYCINWIRQGNSFFTNEFHIEDSNGHQLNIAEAVFIQGLIISAYKNGFRNEYFEADYTSCTKKNTKDNDLSEEERSYMVIDFYDFEKYKKEHPVTPREEGACIKWINDGHWFFNNPLYNLDGMFCIYSTSFLEAYRFYNQAIERYKKRLKSYYTYL